MYIELKDKQDDTGATNKSDDDHPSNVVSFLRARVLL